jgi:hypothetical protein
MFQNVSQECQASFPVLVLQLWQHYTFVFHAIFILVSPTLSWSLSSGIEHQNDKVHEGVQHPNLVAGISLF